MNPKLQLLSPILFASLFAAIAAWQNRLDLGAVLFLSLTMAWNMVRVDATEDTPLPVRAKNAAQRETLLVALVGLGMMALPLVAILTPVLDFALYALPRGIVVVGVLFALAGIRLFWRAHHDLGAYWSPTLEIRQEHQLVTQGIYARIRHPMYSSIFLITAAQACFIGNWIAGPAGLLSFLVLYVARIEDEERMMSDTFGGVWSDYCARTGRLWPTRSR